MKVPNPKLTLKCVKCGFLILPLKGITQEGEDTNVIASPP